VPVIFGFSGDPVAAGVVQSLSRPGGNATGVSAMALELAGKRLSLLVEAAPTIRRIGVLMPASSPNGLRHKPPRRLSMLLSATIAL
jgi:putative ABC transport system substrate-binding protein